MVISALVHAQQPQAPECVSPTQLAVVANQRNAAQDQLSSVIAQANAEMEKLRKEIEQLKAPKK